MKKSELWFVVMVVIVFAIIGSAVSLIFGRFIDFSSSQSSETTAPKTKQNDTISYNPPMPQQSSHASAQGQQSDYFLRPDHELHSNWASGQANRHGREAEVTQV
ncbi:MAG: hypothetical protein WC780_16755 [Lentimicrobiaceae bacterium]|jgi:hypothetical protein